MLPVSASEVEEPHLGHGPRLALAQQESTPHVIGGHMEAESSIRGARADLGDDSGHVRNAWKSHRQQPKVMAVWVRKQGTIPAK